MCLLKIVYHRGALARHAWWCLWLHWEQRGGVGVQGTDVRDGCDVGVE